MVYNVALLFVVIVNLHFRCLKKLKDEFVEELVKKYGMQTLLKLKKMTKEERILKSVETKK